MRLLQETYGEEEIFEWGIAILDGIQQADILRQGMHESSFQSQTENRNELDDGSLPRPPIVAEWLLRDMRERKKRGCSPQRRESSEQRFIKFTESLPELPHKNPSVCKEMFNMWKKSEGLWILQQALYQIQEIRESSLGEWKGGDGMNDVSTIVRRLTPL